MARKHTHFLILFVLLFTACTTNSETRVYRGEEIKMDFSGVRDIPDSAWVKIDGVLYRHYEDPELQFQDSLSLAASKTRYFIQEREMTEPNNPYSIAISLGNFVDLISSRNNEELARVKLDQRYLMSTHGVLMLHHPKGERFSVEVPDNYPVSIEVLK